MKRVELVIVIILVSSIIMMLHTRSTPNGDNNVFKVTGSITKEKCPGPTQDARSCSGTSSTWGGLSEAAAKVAANAACNKDCQRKASEMFIDCVLHCEHLERGCKLAFWPTFFGCNDAKFTDSVMINDAGTVRWIDHFRSDGWVTGVCVCASPGGRIERE